jgi:hypothetical protein
MTKLERLQEIERQAEELKSIASNNETMVEALQQVIREAMVSFKEEAEKECGVDFVPWDGEIYFFVNCRANVQKTENDLCEGDKEIINFQNFFPTESQAEKASKLIRRSNAIIRACLLVDPNYEPDWSDRVERKYSVYYCNFQTKWRVTDSRTANIFVAYVSTYEKAQQVCELLTKWGVK